MFVVLSLTADTKSNTWCIFDTTTRLGGIHFFLLSISCLLHPLSSFFSPLLLHSLAFSSFFSSDVPQVKIVLGAKIDEENIREGMDVYFECIVNAHPSITEVTWMFEGTILFSDPSSGIIISNQSLVLQRVKRQSRGRYWCAAINSEGRGESNEFYLKVLCKYSNPFVSSFPLSPFFFFLLLSFFSLPLSYGFRHTNFLHLSKSECVSKWTVIYV